MNDIHIYSYMDHQSTIQLNVTYTLFTIFYTTKHNLTTISFILPCVLLSKVSDTSLQEERRWEIQKDWSWQLICIYFQSWLTWSNWKKWQFQFFEIKIWKSWRKEQVTSILWRNTKAHNLFVPVTRTKSWNQQNTFISHAVSELAVVTSKHQALWHIILTTNPQ